MIYENYELTPDDARHWLAAHQGRNRHLRAQHVAALARDMAASNWMYTGEAIRFAIDADKVCDCEFSGQVLIDGQHRVSAVVRSDAKIKVVVITDLSFESQHYIDIGAKRAVSDALTLRGVSYGKNMAAVARVVAAIRRTGRAVDTYVKPTHSEILTLLDSDHDRFHRAAEITAMQGVRRTGLTPSIIGAGFFMCSEVSPEAAETFYVRHLIEGVEWTDRHPVKALITRLAQFQQRTRLRMPAVDQYRSLIVAWNYWRSGRLISVLHLPQEWTEEPSPK